MSLALAGAVLLLLALPRQAGAIPAFARQLEISCKACHWAYPQLNDFGESFAGQGYLLGAGFTTGPTYDLGEPTLRLMRNLPLAIRLQGDVRFRPRWIQEYDPALLAAASPGGTEPEVPEGIDFQNPIIVKILSGGPISDHVAYYMYFLLSERGEVAGLEDAWIMAHDFGIPDFKIVAGQYQLSDVVAPRELRLTRQDYLIYTVPLSATGFRLTYQRGAFVEWAPDPVAVHVGVVNGNGLDPGENSPAGYPGRNDPVFDNDASKVGYMHLAAEGPIGVGLLGVYGSEGETATNYLWRAGINADADIGDWRLYGQYLYGRDSNPALLPGGSAQGILHGGYAVVAWRASTRWVFAAMGNRVISTRDPIEAHNYTLNASWYWMTNLKFGVEGTWDAMDITAAHPIREHAITAFVDTAF